MAVSLREEEFSQSGRHVGKYIKYNQLKLCFKGLSTYLVDNWWLEIGQKKRATPQPIEDAFTQVCIGVSGIAQEQELQYTKERAPDYPLNTIIIPVVITNAPIYVAMYDPDDIDLASGTINTDKIFFGPVGQEPEKIDWLLVDYGVTRSVTPERLYENANGTSPVDLEEYHKRSIYIVNSSRIVEFFSRLHPDLPIDLR